MNIARITFDWLHVRVQSSNGSPSTWLMWVTALFLWLAWKIMRVNEMIIVHLLSVICGKRMNVGFFLETICKRDLSDFACWQPPLPNFKVTGVSEMQTCQWVNCFPIKIKRCIWTTPHTKCFGHFGLYWRETIWQIFRFGKKV